MLRIKRADLLEAIEKHDKLSKLEEELTVALSPAESLDMDQPLRDTALRHRIIGETREDFLERVNR